MSHKDDLALMAHLMRRAGFGANRAELERCVAQGYEATVEEPVESARRERGRQDGSAAAVSPQAFCSPAASPSPARPTGCTTWYPATGRWKRR